MAKIECEANYELNIHRVLDAQNKFKAANPYLFYYLEMDAKEMRDSMNSNLNSLRVLSDGNYDESSQGRVNWLGDIKKYNDGLLQRTGGELIARERDQVLAMQNVIAIRTRNDDITQAANLKNLSSLKERWDAISNPKIKREMEDSYYDALDSLNNAAKLIADIKAKKLLVWSMGGGYVDTEIQEIEQMESYIQGHYVKYNEKIGELESRLIIHDIISKRGQVRAAFDALDETEKNKYKDRYDGTFFKKGIDKKLQELVEAYWEAKITPKDFKAQSGELLKQLDALHKEIAPEEAALSARPTGLDDAYAAQSATYGVPSNVTAVTLTYRKAAASVQLNLASRSDKEIMSLTSDENQAITSNKFKSLNDDIATSIGKETGKSDSLYHQVTADKSDDGMSVTIHIPTETGGEDTITQTSEPIPPKEGKPGDAVKVKLSFSIPLSDRGLTILFDKTQNLPLPLTLKDPAVPLTDQADIDTRKEMLIKLYQTAIGTGTPINFGPNDTALLQAHPVYIQMQEKQITSYKDANKWNEMRAEYEKVHGTPHPPGGFIEPPAVKPAMKHP